MLPDLRIQGQLWVEEASTWTLADPLATLPQPTDDLTAYRTFPGAEDLGELIVEAQPDGSVRFTTRLPRRFGAVGALPRDGLWANGGWLPIVLEGGRLVVQRWDAELRLPEGAVGALNGVADERLRVCPLFKGHAAQKVQKIRKLQASGGLPP